VNTIATLIKIFVLILSSGTYLFYSFKIGFWMTGDMHSGGPFAGLLLFPILLTVATFLLFINKQTIRKVAAIGLIAYLALIVIAGILI
jgi:hypothetical protein